MLDLNYICLSDPNPTHLPTHQTLSPNHPFSQHIWSVEYYSNTCAHGVKWEISLDTGTRSWALFL